MATIINKIDAATAPFVGQGDLIIFDAKTIASTTKLADFEHPVSLGQIVQDSTSWEGEEVSTEEIRDEQGNVITSKTVAGTLGFSFDIASTSPEMMVKFMKAVNLTASDLGTPAFLTNATGKSALSGVGFGVDTPVITVPIMVCDEEKNRAWFYPSAKIAASLSLADGLYRIHAAVTAQQVNTAYLKTGMLLEAKPLYESA